MFLLCFFFIYFIFSFQIAIIGGSSSEFPLSLFYYNVATVMLISSRDPAHSASVRLCPQTSSLAVGSMEVLMKMEIGIKWG